MFEVKPLSKSESVTVPGGVFTLTHSCEVLHVDPRHPERALTVRRMKGFLDSSGIFQDFGDPQISELDGKGLADLLADTTGGKPAGAFRTSDIDPAIAKRAAEKAKAEADAAAAPSKAAKTP
jgi:hypothetical protein